MAKFANGGQAVIERKSIVIRVPIPALPMIVEGAWATNNWDTRWKVTDPEAFAKEIVHTLNQEDERGTTAIHRMFDRAIVAAVEDGAEGIDEHEDQGGR